MKSGDSGGGALSAIQLHHVYNFHPSMFFCFPPSSILTGLTVILSSFASGLGDLLNYALQHVLTW